MIVERGLETLLNHVASSPIAMARLACLLRVQNQRERAHELCMRAIAMAPDDSEVWAYAARVFGRDVPCYYFNIVRDSFRNAAYAAAVRRAMRPGCRVLEIGTGTGLMSMMAAHAGAAEVITCEANALVAAAASDVIACNGFADRIQLVAKHSANIEVGIDIKGPADVLISDLVADDVVSLGVLPTIEQAARRLLSPGAHIIPARATVRVCLAEDQHADCKRMGLIEGFDLSPFNRFAMHCQSRPVGAEGMVMRSEADDLFSFNFQSGGPFPESRAAVSLSATGGRVNGLAQWVLVEMDDEGWYENRPVAGVGPTASAVMFHPLVRPIEPARGEIVTVCGAHDRASLSIWAEV
jgi:type II protein arginine methyltransferase